jgi:hypothetical protein
MLKLLNRPRFLWHTHSVSATSTRCAAASQSTAPWSNCSMSVSTSAPAFAGHSAQCDCTCRAALATQRTMACTAYSTPYRLRTVVKVQHQRLDKSAPLLAPCPQARACHRANCGSRRWLCLHERRASVRVVAAAACDVVRRACTRGTRASGLRRRRLLPFALPAYAAREGHCYPRSSG